MLKRRVMLVVRTRVRVQEVRLMTPLRFKSATGTPLELLGRQPRGM
jgi:hypothetical protein